MSKSPKRSRAKVPRSPDEFLPLPDLTFHVLLALAEEDRHGWAVIKTIQEITGGRSNPSSGSLYLAMVRLDERGLIQESAARPPSEADDRRRKYYQLTSLGRRVLEAEVARLGGLVSLARQWNVGR